jgi:hypothetical protein
MSTLRLGVSLQPRWPLDDGTAAIRAASHAEDLGFDHVAVGNRLLDSGFGLDADPFVLLSAVAAASSSASAPGKAERLTLAAAAFLTPPGIPAVTEQPGRPLGGDAATAASVVDDLGRGRGRAAAQLRFKSQVKPAQPSSRTDPALRPHRQQPLSRCGQGQWGGDSGSGNRYTRRAVCSKMASCSAGPSCAVSSWYRAHTCP